MATNITLNSNENNSLNSVINPTHSVTVKSVATTNAVALGLENVTNESKEVQFSSPSFTGVPTAPTATFGTNSTQLATTAFVQAAVQQKDTLAELNDVIISNSPAPSQGHVLFFDSTTNKFKNGSIQTAGITASNIGLGAVSNQSPAQLLNNAALTGIPTAPTANSPTNTTQVATTAFVQNALSNAVTTLQGLTDTTITSIGPGEILVFDSPSNKFVNRTFTEAGITAASLNLAGMVNQSPSGLSVSTATQAALNLKANINSPSFTGVSTFNQAVFNSPVSFNGNVTFNSPITISFPTGSIADTVIANLDKSDVGLGNVDNTADTNKPVSIATQTALDAKAPSNSPTFTSSVRFNSPITVTGLKSSDVGLGNVDNTADTAKPVSTAQQTALNLKADLNSPTFTGTATFNSPVVFNGNVTLNSPATVTGITKAMVGLGNVENSTRLQLLDSAALTNSPTAPTPNSPDSTTRIATTAFVQNRIVTKVNEIIGGAPGALDTLNELAEALNDSPGQIADLIVKTTANTSSISTINTSLGTKADIANPSFTGISTFQQAQFNSPVTFATNVTFNSPNGVSGLTKSVVGLGNVTNESKATMFNSPTFTNGIIVTGGATFDSPVTINGTGTTVGLNLNQASAEIKPKRGTGLLLKTSGNFGAAVSAEVQGPVTVGHDQFNKSGFTDGFADNSNHFHEVTSINLIEQLSLNSPHGDVKNLERVQKRYYAINNDLLDNKKAAFLAEHRVARTVDTSDISVTNATVDVSLLQNSSNRLAHFQRFFSQNISPAGKSEVLTITFPGSHGLSIGADVRFTVDQTFEGPIVAASHYGRVTSNSPATQLGIELFGGNYKTTNEVPLGTSQTALTDGFTLQSIGTGTRVKQGGEVNLSQYDIASRKANDTVRVEFNSPHGLNQNETVTLFTDGRGDLVIQSSAYVYDPHPNNSPNVAILKYGRRISTTNFNNSPFTEFGSSNWSLHKGAIDGLHGDTIGDQLTNFSANNYGQYKAFQIGPGSESYADNVSIGIGVYNDSPGTVKIGYVNRDCPSSDTPSSSAVLNITKNNLQINGNILANASDLTAHTSSTSNPHSVTATQLGLGNVTNESKAQMFSSPTFTGGVVIDANTTHGHEGLRITSNDSGPTLVLARDSGATYNFDHAGSDLRIFGNDTAGNDILFNVDAGGGIHAGKIGVKKAVPTADLHVGGTMTVDGVATFASASPTSFSDTPVIGGVQVATTTFVTDSVATENTLREMDDVTLQSQSPLGLVNGNLLFFDSPTAKFVNDSPYVRLGLNKLLDSPARLSNMLSDITANRTSAANAVATANSISGMTSVNAGNINLRATIANPTFTGTVTIPKSTFNDTPTFNKAPLFNDTPTGIGLKPGTVGLGKVSNQSPLELPISVAVQAALDTKLSSSAGTGISNGDIVQISDTGVAAGELARFTGTGLRGETISDLRKIIFDSPITTLNATKITINSSIEQDSPSLFNGLKIKYESPSSLFVSDLDSEYATVTASNTLNTIVGMNNTGFSKFDSPNALTGNKEFSTNITAFGSGNTIGSFVNMGQSDAVTNKTLGQTIIGSGNQHLEAAPYSTTMGYSNVTKGPTAGNNHAGVNATGLTTVGLKNINIGTTSFVAGRDNSSQLANSIVIGKDNLISSDGAALASSDTELLASSGYVGSILIGQGWTTGHGQTFEAGSGKENILIGKGRSTEGEIIGKQNVVIGVDNRFQFMQPTGNVGRIRRSVIMGTNNHIKFTNAPDSGAPNLSAKVDNFGVMIGHDNTVGSTSTYAQPQNAVIIGRSNDVREVGPGYSIAPPHPIRIGYKAAGTVGYSYATCAVGNNNEASLDTIFGSNNTSRGYPYSGGIVFGDSHTLEAGDIAIGKDQHMEADGAGYAYGHGRNIGIGHTNTIDNLGYAFSLDSVNIGRNITAIGARRSVAIGYKTYIGKTGEPAAIPEDGPRRRSDKSIVIGHKSRVTSSDQSVAIGYLAYAGEPHNRVHNSPVGTAKFAAGNSADNIIAIGTRARSHIKNSTEIGYWSAIGTRKGGIRIADETVAFTLKSSNSPFIDIGSDSPGTETHTPHIGRGMFAFRYDSPNLKVEFNKAGTIKSLSLGAMS